MVVSALQSRVLLEPLLADRLEVAGIVFEDDHCARRFGGSTIVNRADHAAFFDCLRGLGVVAGPTDLLRGTVLAYRSNLLLGVDSKRGSIVRIGSYAADSTTGATPTELLRRRRFHPTTAMPAAVDDRALTAVVRLCRAADGTISSESVLVPSGVDAFDRDVLAFYRDAPSSASRHGHPVASCGIAVETYPLPPRYIPAGNFENLRIGQRRLVVPDEETRKLIAAQPNRIAVAGLRVCIDEAGAVAKVELTHSTGFPSYDAAIQNDALTWHFKPYLLNGEAEPVCSYLVASYRA